MGHYLRLYRTINKTFGFLAAAARHIPDSPGAAGHFGDDPGASTTWIYPRHRKQVIDRPIFISATREAAPRSCTGYCWGAGGMAAFELWEMLFPAITARKLLGRIVPRLDRLSPARYHPSDVHETSLRGIETDDVLWFIRTLDGPFAWAYFLAWQDTLGGAVVAPRIGTRGVTPRDERSLLPLPRGVLATEPERTRRGQPHPGQDEHAHHAPRGGPAGATPTANSYTWIRDPVEVIPSGMSLLAGVLENAYYVWNRTQEEDQRRWLENLYQASGEMLPLLP